MTDYRADLIPDSKIHQVVKFTFNNTYLRRFFAEGPTVLISIGIVVGCFYGQRRLQNDNPEDDRYMLGASIVNTVIIVILGEIYKRVARMLTSWENHKYFEDWENSLITKHFAF